MRFWQQKEIASADASQSGKRNNFSSQAKEFVPKILRGKNHQKDDAETTHIDIIQPDRKNFPWSIKQQRKTDDVEDEGDDDSTTIETQTSPLDCASSPAASTDVSSTPSEHDDQQEDVSDTHTEAELETSKERDCGKDETLELKVSANSWAAKRRAERNSRNAEEMSDEEIVRKMKSILNKLTIEKFPELSKQLACCGIKTSVHLELLIQEIIEKAVSQHHFITMYADLCVVLQNHFVENPISDDTSTNVKKLLLNACQASFEKHLTAPENLKTLEGEDLEAAELMYKLKMLGNIKLVGALLVRKMLASKVLFSIVNALLNTEIPEALETLAALLTVVGPTFDRPDCRHRDLFVGIFDQIKRISKDRNVKKRIRCLLRDLLELRAADWQDSKPKKLEGPSKLDDIAEKFYGEGHRDWYRRNSRADWWHAENHKRSDWGQGNQWKSEWEQGSTQAPRIELKDVLHRFQTYIPQTPTPPPTPQHSFQSPPPTPQSCNIQVDEQPAECRKACVGQSEKWKDEYDTAACNKKIAEAFIVLMKTQDIHQAVASIAALQVPDFLQADQLCDLLRFVVEADVEMVRSLGYQFIVAICLEGCWSHASLVKGFQNFERLCAIKEVNAPDLANILFAEMVPAFTPLVLQGLLPRSLSVQGYREPAENSGIRTDRASNRCKKTALPSKNRRKNNH